MGRRIFVAGHNGMVGRALVRQLAKRSDLALVLASRSELDLTNQQAVQNFFRHQQIDEVYLAAAKVGGIQANHLFPAEFIYQNLQIESNLIHAAHQADIQQLLFLGSSCIYPKMTTQPISEAALLTGPLEPTNEPYAIAKIAGIKLCESYNRQYGRDYRSVMPTNLYGPYDNFHPEYSHVIPALIGKFRRALVSKAAEVSIWGTGNVRREFMHVDDLARACLHLMELKAENYWDGIDPMCSHINIGTGEDCSIKELAGILQQISGYDGTLQFDVTKPEGSPVKRLDVNKLRQKGFIAEIGLVAGLKQTWDWYKLHDQLGSAQ